MSGSSPPSPRSEAFAEPSTSPSMLVPLPILAEEDLAALPPAPSSSLSSASSVPSEVDAAEEDAGFNADEAAPLDASEPFSDEEQGSQKEKEESTSEALPPNEHHVLSNTDDMGGEAQAPVDAPLAMLELLPPPPSSSSPSSSSSSSGFAQISCTSAPCTQSPVTAAATEGGGDGGAVHPNEDADEEDAGADTPTVVDSASDQQDVADEVVSAQPATEGGVAQQDPTSESTSVEDDLSAAMQESYSEDVVSASLRVSEEEATAALNRFSSSLHAKLVEQLIDDAADAVERTLQDTIRQHGTRVRALAAHNQALDARLGSQAAQMQTMQAEWEASILRDLERVLRVDLRAVLRERKPASPSLPTTHASTEQADHDEGHRSTPDEASPAHVNEEACTEGSAPSCGSDANSSRTEEMVSIDELVAAYLGTRGSIERLQRERDAWRQNVSSLQTSLLAATQENATLRHEVEHLRATTVELDLHRAVVQAREEAEHECELLQLQLAKQVGEVETLMALVERQTLTQQPCASQNTTPAATTAASQEAAAMPEVERDDENEEAVRKGPVWNIAMRELEEQATIAANSHHLREQLEKAEAEMKKLAAERDDSVAYATALKDEGDVLRADAQSMVYRNGVLSKQVASLLVKLENTTRAYRHLKASVAPTQPSRDAPATTKNGSDASMREQSLAPSSLLRSLPSTSSRRSNWLATMWPSVNATTSAVGAMLTNTQQQQQPQRFSSSAFASGTGRSLNTAVLYDRPSSSDIQQLLFMPGASADVSFMQASTEVEEGVQQRLSTYATSHVTVPSTLLSAASDSSAHHRHLRHATTTRQTSLRQLGSATLEVSLTSAPRLPASDQLSGSALGRPSTYSTLDPVNGTVTRRVGSAELSVSRGGQVDVSASPASSIIASADDVNEDPQLLCLLDTLDKDESLDRFSVNSVSELVVRNQELVKQLYEATQRAEAAEEQQQQLLRRSSEARMAHSTSHIPEHSQLPASLTTPTSALLQHAETAAALQRHFDGTPSRKRTRDDDSAALGGADTRVTFSAATQQQRGSDGLVQSDHAADSASSDSRDSREKEEVEKKSSAAVEPWFLDSASEAVTNMVDALVRRHEVRLTAVDSAVSSALLRALAAQRETDLSLHQAQSTSSANAQHDPFTSAAGSDGAPTEAAASSRAMAVCLRSLLQLCVRQSATLAEVALDAADQQQEMQKAVKETWTEVQETLLRALQTSQVALAPSSSNLSSGTETLVSSSLLAAPLQQRTRPEAGNASVSTVVAEDREVAPQRHEVDFRVEEQVTLLQELSSLLQTAAKKDGTLLHVYQAAQARQEARQRQQQERMTRMLLKLERKRRLIKALRLRHAHLGAVVPAVGNAAVDAARGLSHAAQDVDNTQGTTASAPFRLSPQLGSPVYRTPPLPPMSLPSATAPGSPQPMLRHARSDDLEERTEHVSSRQSDNSENDSEDEADDDALTLDIFRELQQQLVLSQADHRAVQEELDAEKQRHTAMLERMWALETARDEADAAKTSLENRLLETVPRDAYQALAAELADAQKELQSRDTQLSHAAAGQHGLETKVAALQAEMEAGKLQIMAQSGKLEETVRRHDEVMAREEGRIRELRAQLSDVKQHAATLENANALLRREIHEKTQVIRDKEGLIEELKQQMLTREDVQALLCRLYPDHTVLQANAQLVGRLSQATTRLQLELAEVRQDLAHAKEELRQRESVIREAVQDRQAAEVRLQDAVARLADLQDPELGQTEAGEEVGVSSAINSPTSTNLAALFNVEGASVAALRHRVRYLTARVEAQATDLALVRDTEAAWKAREGDLRRQLEVMSADPVSLTARKYGLTACANFADQIAEMQSRVDALSGSVTAAEAEKKKLEEKLEVMASAAAETERQLAEAVAQTRKMDAQLASAQAESQEQKNKLASLESHLHESASKHVDLLRQHQQTVAALDAKAAALSELQTNLDACRTQRDQFLADNKRMIGAVESLEKALVQSEAEKVMAREALAQGLSSSSRRHRGGGGGHRGTAAERYHNETSLTQDLSLSSIAPSP